MNGFQRHSITPNKKRLQGLEKKARLWIQGHIALSLLILVLGTFMLKGVVGAIKVGDPFSVKQIVISAVTSGVEMDSYGHTNILLLGIGGEEHEGAHLTDTMIIASLDHKNDMVPMLSIPRDLYVENDMVGWGSRLNGVYEFVLDKTEDHDIAMGELQMEIENMLGIDIHYYAMIDFNGFEDVVDAVGGIDIYMEESLSDPFYPAPPGSLELYEPLYIPAGANELDGELALKYARSRQTTSDFDRARRQQEVITAIKDKALSLGFLLNPTKISQTMSAISRNFQTNLSVNEIINLAGMAEDFQKDSLVSRVINDTAYETAGFLYTPEREDYEGAFVLVPFTENNDELHKFAQLFFYHPELYNEDISIQILNGTKTEGLAGLTKMHLIRYGFNVEAYGNGAAKGIEETNIYVLDETLMESETVKMLPSLIFEKASTEIPLEYQIQNWNQKTDIIIELGEDYSDYYKDNEELFYQGFY